MLFYINLGLGLLIFFNFKTCAKFLAKSYVLGEIYVNDILYKNTQNVSYYNLDDFTTETFSDITPKALLAKIEYEDKIRYMVTEKEIQTEDIESLIAITSRPKFFLSVELTHENTTHDVTSEINQLITEKCYEFNQKTAQVLMFIKDNSMTVEMTGQIMWGIITNTANMYNTDNLILNIKENNLVNLKD